VTLLPSEEFRLHSFQTKRLRESGLNFSVVALKKEAALLGLSPKLAHAIGEINLDWPEFAIPFDKQKDVGIRFFDLYGDGNDDIIISNEKQFGIYLYKGWPAGWSRKVMAGKRGDKDALPMISRNGTNNGFWVHSGHLWWSNEDTVQLKDHVDRRSIKELLKAAPK
jgi:hypothetical protein